MAPTTAYLPAPEEAEPKADQPVALVKGASFRETVAKAPAPAPSTAALLRRLASGLSQSRRRAVATDER